MADVSLARRAQFPYISGALDESNPAAGLELRAEPATSARHEESRHRSVATFFLTGILQTPTNSVPRACDVGSI